jgi:hypothetical protein
VSRYASTWLLPSGETVGQAVVPSVEQAYATGQTPALLPSYDRKELTAGV